MNTTTRPMAPYIVGALITGVLILIAYGVFFTPKINEGHKLQAQTEAVQIANQALASKVAVVKNEIANKATMAAGIVEFNKSFPVGASQQTLMADISKAAADSNVALTGLNPALPVAAGADIAPTAPAATVPAATTAPADPEAALKSVQAAAPVAAGATSDVLASVVLTLNASGTRSNLETFTAKLEGLARPVKISAISIDGEGGTVSLNLTAETFFVAPLVDPTASQTK